MTPLVLVVAVVAIGSGATGVLRRRRGSRKVASRQRHALETLGALAAGERRPGPLPAPDPAPLPQAYVRVVRSDAPAPLPAPKPLTGGWRPTRATGAAPFRRPSPRGPHTPLGETRSARLAGEVVPSSLLDFAVDPDAEGAIRLIRPTSAGDHTASEEIGRAEVPLAVAIPLADPAPPPPVPDAQGAADPATADPGTADPGTARPGTARPGTAGPETAGPETGGQTTADPATEVFATAVPGAAVPDLRPAGRRSLGRPAAGASPLLRFDDLEPAEPVTPPAEPVVAPTPSPDERAEWAAKLAAAGAVGAAARGPGSARAAAPPAATSRSRRRRDRRRKGRGRGVNGPRRAHRAGLVAGVAVLVVAAVAAGFLLVSRTPTTRADASGPAVRRVTAPAKRSPAATASTAPSVAVRLISNEVGVSVYQLTRPATITLAAKGPCWVEVRSGGITGPVVYTQTMVAGETKAFSGPAWVRLGNPTDMTVTVGATVLSPPVTVGTPYNLQFQ